MSKKLSKERDYFEWLCAKVPSDFGDRTYYKLLETLFEEDFTYSIDRDANRAIQGANLRKDYADDANLDEFWMAAEPCSVLEMMIALADISETRIMKDETQGDRTGRWFWDMVASMGLMGMDDVDFDEKTVRDKVHVMLDRKYRPNGKGGLFTIPDTKIDLRETEIWYQAMWYLAECLHQKPFQFEE